MARFDVDVLVLGAGAAGLFAATEAAAAGARTLLLEKNRRPGVKILASGGSKCNVTSTLPIEQLGRWFGVRGERFLRHGLHLLGPLDVRRLLAEEGVATSELPLEKVFPAGGRAVDVLQAFLRRLERAGAELVLERPVLGIERLEPEGLVVRTAERLWRARRVVVTVGGASWPRTGCTGDGYAWMQELGHTILRPRPALVPLVVTRDWVRELTGIAVPEAEVSALDARGRRTFTRRRPVLFTHRGLSGPGPMDVSGRLNVERGRWQPIEVDWTPELDLADAERGISGGPGSDRVLDRLPDQLPRRLRAALLEEAGAPLDRRVAELRREERRRLLGALKSHRIDIDGDEGFDKAEVTAGGVALDEIDPRTMASRLVPGLHVAGEILDLDGPIGGFNFQAAFSTGTVAGRAAAASLD